jgi:hypothetical protein
MVLMVQPVLPVLMVQPVLLVQMGKPVLPVLPDQVEVDQLA